LSPISVDNSTSWSRKQQIPQRQFDWQLQPILWQFEASVSDSRRAIIATKELDHDRFDRLGVRCSGNELL
jgi:hypothetical protein